MTQWTDRQSVQEEQYVFPYHYLDLDLEFYRRVKHLDYLSTLRAIKALLAPFEGGRLLDAGCGDGRFCYELREENVRVVGVDYSDRALAFARAFNPSVEFHRADLADLAFEDAFEMITLIEVLEHIPPPDVKKVIMNLWRALTPNGHLVISVPTANLPVAEKHYQHFTRGTLVELFEPMFSLVKVIGHSRGGKVRRRFTRLQRYAELVWPLRHKVSLVRRFVAYVEKYYHENVEFCREDHAWRLIALFRKSDNG